MPEYKKFARGIDFYHGHEINWDIVLPHIDFGIAKCSESTYFKDTDFAKTVEVFYKADKPLLAFHYYDAKYYPSLQFDYNDDTKWVPASKDLQLINMTDYIKFKKIYGLAVDIEEFGNTRVSPSWFSKGAKIFTGRTKDWLSANKSYVRPLVYSRQYFIDEYAPEINNWIHNYDTWVAQWYWNNDRTDRLTWEQFEVTIPPDTAKVGLLGASTTWKFWQYSGDRFIFPGVLNNQGVNRTIDLNLFNGTVEQLHSYLGFIPGQVPVTPPVVYKTYKVITGVNVRVNPSLTSPVVVYLQPGTLVEVSEEKETVESDGYTYLWGKHSKGWSAINRYRLDKEYMRKV